MAEHYDLVILGGGSGNTVVDHRFDGQRIAIVEPGPLGGTCLNRGCIPSKMYVHPADLLLEATRGPALGMRTTQDGADWPVVRDRVLSRIDANAAAGKRGRQEDPGIDYYTGRGRFVGERTLRIAPEAGGDEVELTAAAIVIATGGRPVVPDIAGLHDVDHHTSDTIMRIEWLPRRIAILGGGYIGCEFAHVLAAYGVQVTQIEAGERLLATQDTEIAERFTEAAKHRWDVRLETKLHRVEAVGETARLQLSDGSTVDSDAVLVATGRRPNSDHLGLEHAGVEVDGEGLIVIDAFQRTSADHVWALGDVCTGTPLKHVANHEARVVQHNLLHPDTMVESNHDAIPQAVFTNPQVASVGLTEDAARTQGIDVVVGRKEYADTAFGWALSAGPDDESPEGNGMVKVLLDRASGLLVGAHLIGHQASTLIQPLIMAMAFAIPARDVARGQYWIHPALTEAVEGALLDLNQR